MNFKYLFENFFTHKDFLPPADQLAGTMFTPLHIAFAAVLLVIIVALAILVSKRSVKTIKIIFTAIWATLVVLEVTKIVWESVSGASIRFEWGGILPLYPCSIFMYAMPFAIWGKGLVKHSACGYVCTLGLIGAAVNFVYPATILQNYSCLSFAGFHTFTFHGSMLFCALVMFMSGYHSFKKITKITQVLTPIIPCLLVSIIANAVNFLSPIQSDYMFFRLQFSPFNILGDLLPNLWLKVLAMYIIYLLVHTIPYLPSYIANLSKRKKVTE